MQDLVQRWWWIILFVGVAIAILLVRLARSERR